MKRDAVKKFSEYERDLGIDNSEPEGEHNVVITKATMSAWDDGRPQLRLQCKVQNGEYENRVLFPTLEWFVNPEMDKTDDEKDQIQGFIRSGAMSCMKAIFGRELDEAPDSVEIIGDEDDYEEVARVMQTWADAIEGMPLTLKVSYKKAEDGSRLSDYPRYNYKRAVAAASFSL